MFPASINNSVTARKEHECVGCLTQIKVKEIHAVLRGQYDDNRPGSWHYHNECWEEEELVNSMADLNPDERVSFHEWVAESGCALEELKLNPAVLQRFLSRIETDEVEPTK